MSVIETKISVMRRRNGKWEIQEWLTESSNQESETKLKELVQSIGCSSKSWDKNYNLHRKTGHNLIQKSIFNWGETPIKILTDSPAVST